MFEEKSSINKNLKWQRIAISFSLIQLYCKSFADDFTASLNFRIFPIIQYSKSFHCKGSGGYGYYNRNFDLTRHLCMRQLLHWILVWIYFKSSKSWNWDSFSCRVKCHVKMQCRWHLMSRCTQYPAMQEFCNFSVR